MDRELLLEEKPLTAEKTLRKVQRMLRLEMSFELLVVHELLRAVAASHLIRHLLLQLDVQFVSFTVPVSSRCFFTEELLLTNVTVILESGVGVDEEAVGLD